MALYYLKAREENGTLIRARQSVDKSPFFFLLFFLSLPIRREALITAGPTPTHPLPLPFTSVCLHSSDKQINILSLLIFTSPIPCDFHKVTSSCLPVRPGPSLAPPLWNVAFQATQKDSFYPQNNADSHAQLSPLAPLLRVLTYLHVRSQLICTDHH